MILVERKQDADDVLRRLSLASRIAALEQRSTDEIAAKAAEDLHKRTVPADLKQHDFARNAAETRYNRAVRKYLAAAEYEAGKEKQSKEVKKHLVKFWFVIMDSETAKAFGQTSTALGATHPTDDEAREFSDSRHDLLEDFPGRVYDRLKASDDLRAEAEAIESGDGARLSQTEAQAVYGAAEVRLLKQDGFTHKKWVTMEDELVRPTHVECGNAKPVPIDGLFPNGLRFPGDPKGPAEEVCNCRCWLVGHNEPKGATP